MVTLQINTAGSFTYTPTLRLTEGVHSVTAQVHDQPGNQPQVGPWILTMADNAAPSLDVTKYYSWAASEQFVPRAQRDGIAMRQGDVVYSGLPVGSQDRLYP